MNEKATVVCADSASACGRAFSLFLTMYLREPRKRGSLVIYRGGGSRASDENGWKFIECRAGPQCMSLGISEVLGTERRTAT